MCAIGKSNTLCVSAVISARLLQNPALTPLQGEEEYEGLYEQNETAVSWDFSSGLCSCAYTQNILRLYAKHLAPIPKIKTIVSG